jgi:hypothetical protein
MTTRTIMKARIADEIARDDLTSQIADAITTAISHYQYKRWWFNEDTEVTSSTVIGTEYYSAPAIFFDIDFIRATDGTTKWLIDPTSFEDIEGRQAGVTTNSRPFLYAEYQDQYRLYPVPDAIYTLTWSGVIDRAPASDGETGNPWMTKAEALIRSRAKAVIMLDTVRDPNWKTEQLQLALNGSDCLSLMEQSALNALNRYNVRRVTTGRSRPSDY